MSKRKIDEVLEEQCQDANSQSEDNPTKHKKSLEPVKENDVLDSHPDSSSLSNGQRSPPPPVLAKGDNEGDGQCIETLEGCIAESEISSNKERTDLQCATNELVEKVSQDSGVGSSLTELSSHSSVQFLDNSFEELHKKDNSISKNAECATSSSSVLSQDSLIGISHSEEEVTSVDENAEVAEKPAPKSALKRRGPPPKIDEELQPSPSTSQDDAGDDSPPSNKKRRVHFDGVTVYYFPRKQGFTCVPSQGGSTLGMEEEHAAIEEFGVREFNRVKKDMHRKILLEQHQQGKIYLPPNKITALRSSLNEQESAVTSSSPSVESSDEEDEEDLTIEEYYFLQPITTRQRRLMLRQAGVKKIDPSEKEDCKDIRGSREVCGCDCKVYCDPDTCICAKANIKCQVDRPSFPCGCTKDGCGNPKGRIEFNPIRVRTHFIHTLMRLETEKKCEEIKSKRKKGLTKHIRFGEEDDGIAKIEETEDVPEETGSDVEGGEEDVDVSQFNSNERGSCCDCQNSEVSDFLMRESQYGGAATEMETCSAAAYSGAITAEDNQIGASVPAKAISEMPQVMLYNDEEDYNADANGVYQFTKEESSYSESSDCSSEASNPDQETAPAAASSYGVYQQVAASYDINTSNNNCTTTLGIAHTGSPAAYIPNNDFSCEKAATATAASTTQPEQKYLDLNTSSSAYKLEPISQILNPIRVGVSYTESPPSWGQSSDSFCQFNAGSTTVDGNYQPNSASSTTSSYMFSTTCTDNSYMSYGLASSSVVPSEGAEYSQISSSTSSSTSVTTCQNVTQPTAHQESKEQPKSPCQILDLDKQTTSITSRQLVDLDQQPACSGSSELSSSNTVEEMKESKSEQEAEQQVSTSNTNPTTAISSSVQKKEGTDKGQDTTANAGEECGKDSSATSTDSEDSGLGSLSDDHTPTQDFGEIIKESIVETVSA